MLKFLSIWNLDYDVDVNEGLIRKQNIETYIIKQYTFKESCTNVFNKQLYTYVAICM